MKLPEEASFFPADLLAKAERSPDGGEVYWSPADALAAIDVLEKNGKRILGLDFFKKEGEAMKVLGYPEFDANRPAPESCRLAREYVRAQKTGEAHRFAISWDND